MSWRDWKGTRKLRPRSRVIADMSVNFLEHRVLRRGHRLIRIPEESDDGTDALMRTHHPETTEAETGQVDFQLKATDELTYVENGHAISIRVEVAHLHFWYHQIFHPFILVVYDARKHQAYWVDIQEYLEQHFDAFAQALESESESMTVRIPVSNRLTVRAIDRFRTLQLDRLNRAKNEES